MLYTWSFQERAWADDAAQMIIAAGEPEGDELEGATVTDGFIDVADAVSETVQVTVSETVDATDSPAAAGASAVADVSDGAASVRDQSCDEWEDVDGAAGEYTDDAAGQGACGEAAEEGGNYDGDDFF